MPKSVSVACNLALLWCCSVSLLGCSTSNVEPVPESKSVSSPPRISSEVATKLLAKKLTQQDLLAMMGGSEAVHGKRELELILPLVTESVLRDSRTGNLYRASLLEENKVYVCIDEANAVMLKEDLVGELLSPDGRLIASWTIWSEAFSEATPGPGDEYPGCPCISRKELHRDGNTLVIYWPEGEERKCVSMVPLYAMEDVQKED